MTERSWMDFPLDGIPTSSTSKAEVVAPAAEAKKLSVDAAARQKMALMGSPEEQRLMATAEIQGNRLAQGAEIQDISGLNTAEFALKYGHDAARLRGEYSRNVREINALRNRQRSTADVIQDSAIDVTKMAVNTVGGLGALATNLTDAALGTTLSPHISEALQNINETLEGQQSQLMQDRREQLQIGASLDEMDREARYAERLEANQDSDSVWDRVVKPKLQNWGESFTETVGDYLDDPIMLGSLAPEAIGSLLPMTGAIKVAGRVNAMRALAQRNITGEAAEAYLKTAAGRELLEAQTLKVAPAVMGLTESGGAVHQSQLDILSLSEEELAESTQYQGYRSQGMSHEEAQLKLAREAGTVAGLTAAPGALAAGKLAAPFAAYPLRVGGRGPARALVAAAGNTASEGVEETLQEANSQIASNLGAQSIGLDRDLDEGVAEAAAIGLMGGIAAGGSLQAPGAVLQTGGQVAGATKRAVQDGVQSALEAGQEAQAARADASSPVGTQARAEAAQAVQEGGEQAIAALTTPDATPPQTTPEGEAEGEASAEASAAAEAEASGEASEEATRNQEIATKIDHGLHADPETQANLSQMLGLDPNTRISRQQVVELATQLMDTFETQEGATDGQAMMAILALQQLEEMRKLDSDEIRAHASTLSEGSPARTGIETVRSGLPVLESSPEIERATEFLVSLTPEQVREIIPLSVLSDPESDPKARKEYSAMLATILSVNPEALGSEDFTRVLNQTSGEDPLPEFERKMIKGAEEAARIFGEATAAKEAIAEYAPHYSVSDITKDQIRSDIHRDGNRNNDLPSLREHRTLITIAALSGRIQDAEASLGNLIDFAQTLANKVEAFNKSVTPGPTFMKKVPYQAAGPFGQFFQDGSKGLDVNFKAPNSIALVHEVRADALAAAQLVDALMAQHGLEGSKVEVQDLNPRILAARQRFLAAAPAAPALGANPPIKPKPKGKPRTKPKVPSARILSSLEKHLEARRAVLTLERLKTEYRKTRAALNKAEKAAGGNRPLINHIKSIYGGIHPESDLGLELKALGIRPKDAPGLYSEKGRKDFSNIPASEEAYLGLTIGVAGNGYLDQYGLAEAIVAEISGTPQTVAADQEAARQERDELEKELIRLDREITDLGGEVPVTAPRKKTEAPKKPPEDPKEDPKEDPVDPEVDEIDEVIKITTSETWLESLKAILPKALTGIQNFIEAFRARSQDEGSGSKLMEQSDPIAWLRDQLAMPETIGRFGPDQAEALERLVDQRFTEFQETFEGRAQKLIEEKGWDTPEKLAKALGYDNALPLNLILDTGHLEPKVMAALFVSTYEWMAQNARAPRKMDDDDINKMFGRPRGTPVTSAMRTGAQHGVTSNQAQEAIASNMMTLLDISPKRNGDIRMTQGIFRSLAANALEQLMDEHTPRRINKEGHLISDGNTVTKVGTIGWNYTEYRRQDGSQAAPMITLRPHHDPHAPETHTTQEDLDFQVLVEMRSPFTETFTEGRVRARHVGEGSAPKSVRKTKLGNPLARTSKPENKAQERLQNAPNYVNMPMMNLVRAMGTDAYRRMVGYVELTEETRKNYSPDHLLSIEGRNQTIDHDLSEAMAYLAEVERHDAESPGKVQIFFEWAVSSVGRLQQMGPTTPQGSKITRELLGSTHSVLELTGENAEQHERALWFAVAQSLGEKIEKMSVEAIEAKAQELVSKGAYGRAVELFQAMEEGQTLDSKTLGETLEETLGVTEDKVVHALLTVARWNLAKGRGDQTFETALALEADGKTDGPVNAMIHMGMGPFSAHELKLWSKGGMFFVDRPVSLSEFIALEDKDGADIYNMTSAVFEEKLREAYPSSSRENLPSVMGLLNTFLPDFTFIRSADDTHPDLLKVERNVVKNPLTVFLYGSGAKGIAGKVASQVQEEIGIFLSELIQLKKRGLKISDHPKVQENPQLLEDMADLLFRGSQEKLLAWLRKPEEASISPQMYTSMQEQILGAFVEPMVEAIDEVTGGLQSRMKFMQASAEMQTLIFQEVFESKLNVARATKEKGALLSEQEVQDLFAETMDIAPIYGGNDQEFHISAPKRDVRLGARVASSFTGKLPSMASYSSPADASVKVSPYLTIGNGDGKMILNIYTRGDGSFETSLPVFDGVEMALHTVEGASKQINEQTYQAWMEANPYRDVEEGFARMLAQLTPEVLAKLPPRVKSRIQKLAENQELGKGLPLNQILKAMHEKLAQAARLKDARIAVMKKVTTSSDHMAAFQIASFQEGISTGSDPTDYAGIISVLNPLLKEELAKTAPEGRETVGDYAQAPVPALEASIQELGEEVSPGVRKLSGQAVMKLLQGPADKTGATAEQRGLLKDLEALGPLPKDMVFYIGPAQELSQVRDEWDGATSDPVQMGQAHPMDLTAFVANVAPETIIHELLHLYTAMILNNHYTDPTKSAPHVRHAVAQLEKLADKTRELNTYGLAESDEAALRHIQKILGLWSKPNQRPAQLGELISYMLSNPGLIEKGKKTSNYQALTSIVTEALKWIKKLLGIKGDPGMTLYSNIRFNTRLLLAQEPSVEARFLLDPQTIETLAEDLSRDLDTNRVLNQVYGEDPRLNEVEGAFLEHLNRSMEASLSELARDTGTSDKALENAKAVSEGRVAKMRQTARMALGKARANGFLLNAREASAFEAIHAAVLSGMTKGAPVHQHLYQAFAHVVKTLTPEQILEAMGTPAGDNPSVQAHAQAQAMVDFLIGAKGLRATADGRSDMLASFLALSQTHPVLREALGSMKPPKVVGLEWTSVDAWLSSLARTITNLITRMSLSPRLMAPNMLLEMDALSSTLSSVQEQRRGLALLGQASELLNDTIEKANAYTANKISRGSSKATRKLTELGEKFSGDSRTNRYVRGSFFTASFLTSLGSTQEAGASGDALMRMVNDSPGMHTLRSLLTDLRGATADTLPLWRLINPIKDQIDGLRQDSREGIPKALAAEFSRPVTREEWSRMTRGVAKADLLALGHEQALKILKDPSSAKAEVQRLEEEVSTMGGRFGDRYKAKAKALATYMVSGVLTTRGLMPNAHAIAHLYGEQGNRGNQITAQVTPDLVRAIDQLTSLYAFEALDQGTRDTLAELMSTEAQGMQAVTGMLRVARQAEIERRDRHGSVNEVARNNGLKGYVPINTRDGHSVVVRPASEHDDLVRRGYERIGAYRGDSAESRREPMAYYLSTVAGKGMFRQGVAQTVNDTWQGVDARTGSSLSGKTAGLYLGRRAAALAQELDADAQGPQGSSGALDRLAPGEYLMPIFDGEGTVVAYQRAMDPEKTDKVQSDDHLGRMLGVWMGRILEENMADETNLELVKTLREIYGKALAKGDTSGFINIADPKLKDPVIKDAWDILGWRIKQDVAEAFGSPQEFWVRKDMVDDAIGFRAATLTDAWTGITRWSPEVQEKMMQVAELVGGLGNQNAFKRIRQGERIWREGVSWAKETIIIRSIKVSLENGLSNVAQLVTWGIPIVDIVTGFRNKFAEVSELTKNREEIQNLQVKMATVIHDPKLMARYQAQIEALEEANRSMSIQPLIEAGEFSTIAEGLDEADIAYREGVLGDYISRQIDRLPGWGKTAAKNLLITKDTALWKGLNRAVQYGDFIAKAVLYDHLTKKKGMERQEVLDILMEEFIQYNRASGRTRDAIEGMGLAWFLNYKLRIMKVTARALRERPLTALTMFSGTKELMGIDTTWDGSVAGAVWDDRFGYSLGTGMGFNAPSLHPVGSFVLD